MNKSQAEAIAESTLEMYRVPQDQPSAAQLREQARLAYLRNMAGLGLAGAFLGAASAYFTNVDFFTSVLGGGLAGHAIGWAVLGWRNR